jgi:hypothetical protein
LRIVIYTQVKLCVAFNQFTVDVRKVSYQSLSCYLLIDSMRRQMNIFHNLIVAENTISDNITNICTTYLSRNEIMLQILLAKFTQGFSQNFDIKESIPIQRLRVSVMCIPL